MKIEASNEKEAVQNPRRVARPQHVLFAKSPPGTAFGVVSDSEPSSLALLAAGVAGMAPRRARRSERMKFLQTQKTET
jgi:hypothetical protein